jgi:hypothetical protein
MYLYHNRGLRFLTSVTTQRVYNNEEFFLRDGNHFPLARDMLTDMQNRGITNIQ